MHFSDAGDSTVRVCYEHCVRVSTARPNVRSGVVYIHSPAALYYQPLPGR
jgi:hypothetical protein